MAPKVNVLITAAGSANGLNVIKGLRSQNEIKVRRKKILRDK